jgi:hypothetical protein
MPAALCCSGFPAPTTAAPRCPSSLAISLKNGGTFGGFRLSCHHGKMGAGVDCFNSEKAAGGWTVPRTIRFAAAAIRSGR